MIQACVILFGTIITLVASGNIEDDAWNDACLDKTKEILDMLNNETVALNESIQNFGTRRILNLGLDYVRLGDMSTLHVSEKDPYAFIMTEDEDGNTLVSWDFTFGLRKFFLKAVYVLHSWFSVKKGNIEIDLWNTGFRTTGQVTLRGNGSCDATLQKIEVINSGYFTTDISMTRDGDFIPVFLGPYVSRFLNSMVLPRVKGHLDRHLQDVVSTVHSVSKFSKIVCKSFSN